MDLLFPLPIVFVGSKWDIMISEFEPERVKQIIGAIRFLAIAHGAHFLCTSTKNKVATVNMKALFKHVLFK